MTTITTRAGKGAPLTNAELDANFTNLNSGKMEATATTTDLAEGSNLYFTQARARGALSAVGSISYDQATGVISYTQGNSDTITEGSTNLFFTQARARASISVTGAATYNSTTGVLNVTGGVTSVNTQTGAVTLVTDNIGEGSTNKYYTDARARAAVSFSAGSGAYNSSTGVFSIPTNTNQLTNGAGFITGSGNTTGSSGSIAVSGGWSVTPSGTKIYFAYNGVNKASLDSSGNLICVGNITAYGTT